MNYEETKEYLKRYLKARIPVIAVNSVEKNSFRIGFGYRPVPERTLLWSGEVPYCIACIIRYKI